ncbi:serine/threonine-protein kinase [Paraliomyxa miuraensis]|uniref:serine/threonine-protein kinase n=1 Tax=Paraliomyxa miuraensis TaxID=376150 RepID=UPI00224DCC25|nr:serine/threonine-protein kinase [Paraliomyxa miuraensis]MCX4242675.1 serine/threonine protein kinase [Paraliomyxa miuraensis]
MPVEPPSPPPGAPRPPTARSAERAETIAMLGSVPAPTPVPAASAPSRSLPSGPAGPTKRCPTCGERFPIDYRVCPRDVIELEVEADDDRDPYVGTTLAQTYRVVRRIGIGGMGAVYEASHTRLASRRFAIKVMHDELVRKGDLAARFRREAEVAGMASHPNVVAVFDLDETPEGVPFIVSEYLEGEDLGQRLDRVGTLSLIDTVHVVRQLCAALTVVHAVGVVHRDLKPDNVFLVGETYPEIKLLDFGIARLTDVGTADRTRTGIVMGTPAYMAPEQAAGLRVDHRCDVYAVGAILYRCLTGHPVYDHEDPAATLTAVLTREPERPRKLVPELSEAVELVIERAIAREPEERFQTMMELDAALAGLVGQAGPVTAGKPAPAEGSSASPGALPLDANAEAGRVVQRARPTIVATTALGLLLMVGIVSDLVARLIVTSSEQGRLTANEGVLVVLGVIATLATPLGLWIRMLVTRVWHNSLRAVALARRSTVTVAAAASAYACVMLLGRVLDLGLSEEPHSSSGLLAAILASVAAGIAATTGLLLRRPLRRRDPALR